MTNSWTDFMQGVANGSVPDLDLAAAPPKTAQQKTAKQKTAAISQIRTTQKRASELSEILDAKQWLNKKLGFVDASSLQGGAQPMDPSMMGGAAPPPMDPSMAGGAPPPMDPSMMGGAPPMDPSMMGGAPPPPMDPSMMGGAPPADPSAGAPLSKEDVQKMIDDAVSAAVTGQSQQQSTAVSPTGQPKGKDAQQQMLNKVLRLTELVNGLYNAMQLPIPLSVIDDKANDEAVMQQNGINTDGGGGGDAAAAPPGTIPDNPMIREIKPMGKAAGLKQQLKAGSLKSKAILDYLSSTHAN